jgi:hypothetical protein
MHLNQSAKLRTGLARSIRVDNPPPVEELISDLTVQFGKSSPFCVAILTMDAAITFGVYGVGVAFMNMPGIYLPIADAQFSTKEDAYRYCCQFNVRSPFSISEQIQAEVVARKTNGTSYLASSVNTLVVNTAHRSHQLMAVAFDVVDGYSYALVDRANPDSKYVQPIFDTSTPRSQNKTEASRAVQDINRVFGLTVDDVPGQSIFISTDDKIFAHPLMSVWHVVLPATNRESSQRPVVGAAPFELRTV